MVQHPLAFPCACRRRGVLTQFTRPRQPRGTPRRYLALDSSRRRGEPPQRTHLRTKRPWSQRGKPPQRFCEKALQERRLLSEKLPTQNAPWLSLRRRRTCTHVLSRVSRNGGNLRNVTVSPRWRKTQGNADLARQRRTSAYTRTKQLSLRGSTRPYNQR